MPDWRRPTFDEAQIVLKQEKKRIQASRSFALIFILLFFAYPTLGVMEFTYPSSQEVKTILGYDYRFPPAIDLESNPNAYQEQMQEIAHAKDQARKKALIGSIPRFIVLVAAFGGVCALFFMPNAIKLSRYRKNQYMVSVGICVVKLLERQNSYYVTAFFEDGSTQEARASRDVFYEAEPYSQLLILHLDSHKEWGPRFMRAFVVGPPVQADKEDKPLPEFVYKNALSPDYYETTTADNTFPDDGREVTEEDNIQVDEE